MADSTIVVSDANDVDRTLRTDEVATVHTPHHIVASSALPTLASTSTLQSTINSSIGTGNTSLATIAGDTTSLDGKVTACNTGAVVLAGGTAEIGKLAAGTANIGDVDVLTLPGTAAEGASLPSVFTVVAADDGSNTQPLQMDDSTGGLKVILQAGSASAGTVVLGAGSAAVGTVALGAGAASIGRLGTANSGVDIGDVDVTSVAIPTTIYHGQETVDSAGTDQTIRPAGSQAITSGVTVKALAGNAGIVYVGAEGVAAAAGFELSAKESVFIEVADIASVWVDAAQADDGVSWIAT